MSGGQSHRALRSSAPRPKLLRAPLFTDALSRRIALASPSAARRAKQMRSSLSCEASAAALRPYTSTASQLRLSGDPPDSLSRGTIRLNASRRAGCEGAREGLGSHAASLNDGLGWVHVQEAANPLLGFELWSVPQGAHVSRRLARGLEKCVEAA